MPSKTRQVRKPTLRSHGLLRAILLPCPTFIERAVNRGRADRSLLRVVESGPDISRPWEPHDLDSERVPCIGAIGYLDFAGNLDCCIGIRTVTVQGAVASVQAGAGIVADSDPTAEFEETHAKAQAMLRAIQIAQEVR